DNEGIGRNSENRGDRVNRENQIRELNHHQHEQQERSGQLALFPGKELFFFVMTRNRQKARYRANQDVLFWLDLDLFVPKHLDSGVNQETAENVDDPVKPVDQRRADENHRQTHEQRAHHAPKEHAMLKLRRDLEIGKDEQEDK